VTIFRRTLSDNNTITRLVAESINPDTSVLEEGWKVVERDGKSIKLWNNPQNATGWPYTGNTHRVVVIARPMLEN